MKKYVCFHFSRNDDCLGYGDGRKIVLGETLSVDVDPKLCHRGLHGSQSVIDALGYASGSHLWLVEIWGDVDTGNDKLCGAYRKAIRQYGDILPLVVEFAKWCADRAAKYAAKYAAESAEYAAEYAAESAEYAAESAAESAEYAAESAEYAAESAEYAAESAEYAAESAAKSAKSAAKSAKYAASSAKYAAEYAAKSAKYAAKKERDAQENWWSEKLQQLS